MIGIIGIRRWAGNIADEIGTGVSQTVQGLGIVSSEVFHHLEHMGTESVRGIAGFDSETAHSFAELSHGNLSGFAQEYHQGVHDAFRATVWTEKVAAMTGHDIGGAIRQDVPVLGPVYAVLGVVAGVAAVAMTGDPAAYKYANDLVSDIPNIVATAADGMALEADTALELEGQGSSAQVDQDLGNFSADLVPDFEGVLNIAAGEVPGGDVFSIQGVDVGSSDFAGLVDLVPPVSTAINHLTTELQQQVTLAAAGR